MCIGYGDLDVMLEQQNEDGVELLERCPPRERCNRDAA